MNNLSIHISAVVATGLESEFRSKESQLPFQLDVDYAEIGDSFTK